MFKISNIHNARNSRTSLLDSIKLLDKQSLTIKYITISTSYFVLTFKFGITVLYSCLRFLSDLMPMIFSLV